MEDECLHGGAKLGGLLREVEETASNLVARTIRGWGAQKAMYWLAVFVRYLFGTLLGRWDSAVLSASNNR